MRRSPVAYQKFDARKLERLNDEGRFETLIPEAMWEALGDPLPRTIVEIGSGPGLFASRFATMAPQATVYAVDTEPVMVEWMRANLPAVAEGRVVPVLSEETRIPLSDGVADLVTMINLHHELAEPSATYAEAFRLLGDDGQVLVVDWAQLETPHGPSLSVRVSAETLVQFVNRAGFTDVRTHEGLPWHSMVTARKKASVDA
jgi:ubiquinone/menaquinone biosynthesis C-methylase UbiE